MKNISFKNGSWLRSVVQIALIIGIVALAMEGKEGWGWLTLALILSL